MKSVYFALLSSLVVAGLIAAEENPTREQLAAEMEAEDPYEYFGGDESEAGPESESELEGNIETAKRLRFYNPQKRLRFYSPEKRLRFYTPEKRLRFQDPLKRLRFSSRHLTPEKRLRFMTAPM